MLIKILIAVAVVVVLFVVVVAMQPAGFRVTRFATIGAPPAIVFSHVNDLHNWEAWSPWAKLDPAAKNTYDGASFGVGAGFGWSGNNQVGHGHMTITESKPCELVRIKLEFLKPFKAINTAEFTFKPEGDGTGVTWSMTGQRNFVMKAFGLFMDCDKMCGDQFEKGLAQLNSVAGSLALK